MPDGLRVLPADAWRPAIAPLPPRPLTPWNPIAARYLQDLNTWIKYLYGPVGEVVGQEFALTPDGPSVVLLARLTVPYPAFILGQGDRPEALVFGEPRRFDTPGEVLLYARRYLAELVGAWGYAPPVPQVPQFP